MLLSIKRRVHQYLLRDPAFRFLFDEPPPGEAVAIDCETTGLNTREDDIVTIAAIRIRGSRILASERFESMVKPNARMKAEAIKVHRLREGDVAGGRTMEQVLPELLRYIGSRPLVGYYLEFDLAMVNKHMRRMLGIELPNARIEVSGLYYERKYGDAPPDTQIDLRIRRDPRGSRPADLQPARRFRRRPHDGDDVCDAYGPQGPQHPHPAPARKTHHAFRRRVSVRLSTAKRRPLDACPFEVRQKICRKITNSKPDRIIAIGSVRAQASARLQTDATRTPCGCGPRRPAINVRPRLRARSRTA